MKHTKLNDTVNTLRQFTIDGDVEGVEKELASLSADEIKEVDAIIVDQFNEACSNSGITVTVTESDDE